jgi:hypothetical protein
MTRSAWEQLLDGQPWFHGAGKFPLPAYSEFMPPVRFGPSPYGARNPSPQPLDDPHGWLVSEYEEAMELRPGLQVIADQLVHGSLAALTQGRHTHGISKFKLTANPYWPRVLADRAGSVPHERFLALIPLALSRTQDEKGRIRWTLFGGSHEGPCRAFWKSFRLAPNREVPADVAAGWIWTILERVYGVRGRSVDDLRAAGFRILPDDRRSVPFRADWSETKLPRWTRGLIARDGEATSDIKFLLTFRPFETLPEPVQKAYFAGALHLLPFPGSLIPWGVESFVRLAEALPFASQIPLLHMVARHESAGGIRVPQSGWLHEPRPHLPPPDERFGPLRGTFRRAHRNLRELRDARHRELIVATEDHMTRVLFSTAPEVMGLYNKPMARNAQIWTHEFACTLHGPNASRAELEAAAQAVEDGGLFGYRFVNPAMRVGVHELYWHRPLIAWMPARDNGRTEVIFDGLLGYLTAHRLHHTDDDEDAPIELWPRLQRGALEETCLRIFPCGKDERPHQAVRSVFRLLRTHALLGGKPLPESFATRIVLPRNSHTFDEWLAGLPNESNAPEDARVVASRLRELVASDASPEAFTVPAADAQAEAFTYSQTTRRGFETAYWNTIKWLSSGRFPTRNAADTARDPASQAAMPHPGRDLDRIPTSILARYARVARRLGMEKHVFLGALPFPWRTDFEFAWSNGWLNSQREETRERDLIVMIPGRDRRRAVIMADHYDTAYMEDRYDRTKGGDGARVAAPGADDNGSATAALLMAAAPLLGLSREGRLGCDVWLIHLTGEEFPSDCLGARHLAEALVERTLWGQRLGNPRRKFLSTVDVTGVFVLDMIAHNNPQNPHVFQIAPGASRESMELGLIAHTATAAWNRFADRANRRRTRVNKNTGSANSRGDGPPARAPYPRMVGEVRPPYARRSTLFNTDGQIFSDAGIPVVLFMEDYDINRKGYHDSEDVMANIDLDYGAALAAIAIETVARTTWHDRSVSRR